MNKIFLVLQPFFLQEQISNFLGRTNNKKKETNKQKIKKFLEKPASNVENETVHF